MHAAHLVAELAEPTSAAADNCTDPFFDIVLADPDLLAREFEEVVAGLTPGEPPSGAVATPSAPDSAEAFAGPPLTVRLNPSAGREATRGNAGRSGRSPPEGSGRRRGGPTGATDVGVSHASLLPGGWVWRSRRPPYPPGGSTDAGWLVTPEEVCWSRLHRLRGRRGVVGRRPGRGVGANRFPGAPFLSTGST